MLHQDEKSNSKLDVLSYFRDRTTLDAERAHVIMQEMPDEGAPPAGPIKESSKLPFIASEDTVPIDMNNFLIKVSDTEIMSFREYASRDLMYRLLDEQCVIDFPAEMKLPTADIRAVRVYPLGEQASKAARSKGKFRPYYDIETDEWNAYVRYFFKTTDRPGILEPYDNKKKDSILHNPNNLRQFQVEMSDVTMEAKDLSDVMMQKLTEAKEPSLNKIAARLKAERFLSIVVPFQIKDIKKPVLPVLPVKVSTESLEIKLPAADLQSVVQQERLNVEKEREQAIKSFMLPLTQAESKESTCAAPWVLEQIYNDIGALASLKDGKKADVFKQARNALAERNITIKTDTLSASASGFSGCVIAALRTAGATVMATVTDDGINNRSQLTATSAVIERKALPIQGHLVLGKPFGTLLDAGGVLDLSRCISAEQVDKVIREARQEVAANCEDLRNLTLAADSKKNLNNPVKTSLVTSQAAKTLAEDVAKYAMTIVAQGEGHPCYYHAVVLSAFITNYKNQPGDEEALMHAFQSLFIRSFAAITAEAGFQRFAEQYWLLKAMVHFNLRKATAEQRDLLEMACLQLGIDVAAKPSSLNYIVAQPFFVMLPQLKNYLDSRLSQGATTSTNLEEWQCVKILRNFLHFWARREMFRESKSYYAALIEQLHYLYLGRKQLSSEEAFQIFIQEGAHLLQAMVRGHILLGQPEYEYWVQAKSCVADAMSKVSRAQWTAGVLIEYQAGVFNVVHSKISSLLKQRSIEVANAGSGRFFAYYENPYKALYGKVLHCTEKVLSTDNETFVAAANDFKAVVKGTKSVASALKTLEEETKRNRHYHAYSCDANPEDIENVRRRFIDMLLYSAVPLNNNSSEEDRLLYGAALSYLMSLPKAESEVIEAVTALDDDLQKAKVENGNGQLVLTFADDHATVRVKPAAADSKEIARAGRVVKLSEVLKHMQFSRNLSIIPPSAGNTNATAVARAPSK